MNANQITETVKGAVAGARSRAELIGSHGRQVVQTGTETLQAAREVVVNGGHQAVDVLAQTRDELRRTLKDGAARIGHQLSHLATPTHKEEAVARKEAVKDKKQRRRGGNGAAKE
jgi:hypothetical protein